MALIIPGQLTVVNSHPRYCQRGAAYGDGAFWRVHNLDVLESATHVDIQHGVRLGRAAAAALAILKGKSVGIGRRGTVKMHTQYWSPFPTRLFPPAHEN